MTTSRCITIEAGYIKLWVIKRPYKWKHSFVCLINCPENPNYLSSAIPTQPQLCVAAITSIGGFFVAVVSGVIYPTCKLFASLKVKKARVSGLARDWQAGRRLAIILQCMIIFRKSFHFHHGTL